jgi:hypothetical protein
MSVAPNPLQSGSIHITKPVATGIGFQSGRSYLLQLTKGESNPSAIENIGEWVVADKSGALSWTLKQDPFYGYPDAVIVPGVAELTVSINKPNGETVVVTKGNFMVTPNPGSAGVSPVAAAPGTGRIIAGSGAQALAQLRAEWFESTQCSCWLAGCSECVRTLRTLDLQADGAGAFASPFSPAIDSGYCNSSLSITDKSNGLIVATTQFSYCP